MAAVSACRVPVPVLRHGPCECDGAAAPGGGEKSANSGSDTKAKVKVKKAER